MIYDKVYFDEADKNAYLEVFAPDKVGSFVRSAMLVIPGGGYQNVCSDREGEPVALSFLPYGYCSFVLHYTVREKPFPSHLIQASKAVKYIKDNAEKYNVDGEKVFAVGFSAGGHLAATLGAMWDMQKIYDETGMKYKENKPKGVILMYPVVSADFHAVSFKNLFVNEELTEERKNSASVEKHISSQAAPMFIVHTSNDEVVNVKNSLVLASALKDKDIPFEMHIYPDAPHGVALGNEITKCGIDKWSNKAIEKWVANAAEWAESL